MVETIDEGQEHPAEMEQHKVLPSVVISNAWGEKTAHTTSYDGGKIVMCSGFGAKNLYGYPIKKVEEGDNPNDDKESNSDECTPFLAAMCNGDVALIDAAHGIKVRTLRAGFSTTAAAEVAYLNEMEEDYEHVDPDGITMFALSSDDCDIVTASRNTVLRHYDISGEVGVSYKGEDGKGPAIMRKTFGKSHRLPVKCMEFHKSGVFFATGSVDGTAKVWDMRGGFATHAFQPKCRQSGPAEITALSWAPGIDKLMLAAGTKSGSISLFDLNDSTHVIHLSEHVSTVTCMKWTLQGDFFFTAGRDSVINMWSVKEKSKERPKKKSRQSKHEDQNEMRKPHLAYEQVGTQPVYEQVEGMVLVTSHSHGSKSLILATAGEKGQVRLWKTIRGKPDSEEPPLTRLENIKAQSEDTIFGAKRGGYTSLMSANAGEELVAVDAEHNMTFLNASDLSVDRTIVGHNDEILDLCIIPRKPKAESVHKSEEVFIGKHVPQRIAIATNSAQVRLFDIETFSCTVLDGHSDTVLALAVSPCGRFLVTSGKDNTMRLWHIESAKCVGIGTGHTEGIGATALSRKIGKYEVTGKANKSGAGAFAVTASKDRTLKRWRLPGASELDNLALKGETTKLDSLESVRAHEKEINIVSIAPNDSLIATGSQDRTVKLWHATDLGLQGVLSGHKRGVWDCQFSPYDRVIATSSADQTIRIWSLSTLGCLRTFQGHTASVLRVRFLTGGLQLLSSGADGLVKLWTIRSNECEATMDGHTDKVWALDISSETGLLVSGGADSRIVVWKDITEMQEQERRKEEEQTLLMEQRLANHLRFNEYEKALELALELDKPHQALKVFNSLVENELRNRRDALIALKKHVKSWEMSRVSQVMRYCREWNTRARNSQIAMLVVKTIFSVVPVAQLAATDGIPEIMAGLVPYTERHFVRLDRLYGNSYILDYMLHSMGTLLSDNKEDEYSAWESNAKLVLPPKHIVEQMHKARGVKTQEADKDGSDDEVVTVGDSGSDSDDSDIEDVIMMESLKKDTILEETAVSTSGSSSSSSDDESES